MSCHVAIVVSILKNHSQKLFHFTKLFINILQASLLVIWIATPHFVRLAMTDMKNKIAHAVRHMAMTITKIFNSISFRDYSLLFIKKFINKGDFKMRNQTNNVFKIKRQKSKLFLIILCVFGLLFSWSCSCKNRVSNPDDTPTDGGVTPPPAGTFSISEATNNVTTNFVVKTASTVGEIKIGFVSANNYAYTLSYEVVDNEGTDDNSKILKSDTEYANDVLTIKDTGLKKIRAIDSSTAPAVRTITINFTFTANDKTLNNYTQTLSVKVELTHAQKLDDSTSDAIQSILQKGLTIEFSQNGPPNRKYEFPFSSGTYSAADKTFTIENETTDDLNISKARVREFGDYNFTTAFKPYGLTGVRVKGEEAGGGANDTYYTLTYNVTFSEDFETEITQIKLKLDNKSTSIKFIEDRLE